MHPGSGKFANRLHKFSQLTKRTYIILLAFCVGEVAGWVSQYGMREGMRATVAFRIAQYPIKNRDSKGNCSRLPDSSNPNSHNCLPLNHRPASAFCHGELWNVLTKVFDRQYIADRACSPVTGACEFSHKRRG